MYRNPDVDLCVVTNDQDTEVKNKAELHEKGKPRPPNTVTSHCSSNYGALVLTALWRSGLIGFTSHFVFASLCQEQLPATGVPITRHRFDHMKDKFDEYVKNRTLQNWKFWIVSFFSAAKQNKNSSISPKTCRKSPVRGCVSPCV